MGQIAVRGVDLEDLKSSLQRAPRRLRERVLNAVDLVL